MAGMETKALWGALGATAVGLGFAMYQMSRSQQESKQELLEALKALKTNPARRAPAAPPAPPVLANKASLDMAVEQDEAALTAYFQEKKTIHEQYTAVKRTLGRKVTIHDLENILAAMGHTLHADEKEMAREIMGVEGDEDEVSFSQFLLWWKNFRKGVEDHEGGRGRNAEYTRRFKLAVTDALDSFDPTNVKAVTVGTVGTPEYRLFFEVKNVKISPWHDIPYKPAKGKKNEYHCVIEIPKYTRAKFEITTGELKNPVKQDTKNGRLRDLNFVQCFNYGAIPQTWEDPKYTDEATKCIGDNDPIDVVEIGRKQLASGTVLKVKVIGIFAMIDDGETDWKVIVINSEDPLAAKINDLASLEKEMPGCIQGVYKWFREYKSKGADGPFNKFGFDDQCKDVEFAVKIIEETHEAWNKLMSTGKTTIGDTHAAMK